MSWSSLRRRRLEGELEAVRDPADRRRLLWKLADLEQIARYTVEEAV